MSKNYYEILEVDKKATKDEIKSALRKKARIYHPDVNKAPDAEEKFKELGKAYETLMDDDKRALYDRYGEDGLKNAGYSTNGPFDFGFGNLNDIFESFFGGGFGGGRYDPNAPMDGDDLRYNMELEFEEAIFGVEKDITITHTEVCPKCNGSKAEPGSKTETCKTCGGRGKVQQTMNTMLGQFTQVGECPTCHGTGKTISNPCKNCNGAGVVEVEKKIHVKIPAGVDSNAKIRLSHEGNAGVNGGYAGDLYIVLYIKKNKKYKRDGYNLYTELEISMPQAVLGDTIEVGVLKGEKADLKIPAGVETGEILTLKNQGVPYLGRTNQRGDMYFVVKVKTATNLSEEEKKLYTKLFELSQNKKYTNESIFDKVKNVLGSN